MRRLSRLVAPLGIVGALGSCETSTQVPEEDATNTVLLAPILSTDFGVALPRVDSVRFSIDGVRSGIRYYAGTSPWSRHGDTLHAIPVGESLLVRIEGLRTQIDSSEAVWWSGSARVWLSVDGGGIRSASLPVAIRDTIPPAIVARGNDTLANADSVARAVWRLGAGCGCTAVVDGDAVAVVGDSATWTGRWISGSRRAVVASFRDKAGNLVRDTVEFVRRRRVADPTIALSERPDGRVVATARSATEGASFECSLDSGSVWVPCGDSIVVESSVRLFARATKEGMDPSGITEGNCVVVPAVPTFSVASGTAWNDLLAVRISTSIPGAQLQYSIDGEGWLDYRDSVVLGRSATLRARAVGNGVRIGGEAEATYRVKASTPTFSVNTGASFPDVVAIRIASATPGAMIECSADSGMSWSPYRDSIVLGESAVLMARAGKDGLASSDTASARYFVSLPAPTFSVPSDSRWNDLQVVRIACSTPGATLLHSTDSASWHVGDSIVVGDSIRVWARAVKPGMAPGPVAKAVYAAKAAAPTFSRDAGIGYADAISVLLSSATPDARLQYSLDSGATWNDYSDSIEVARTVAIRARTVKTGLAASEVVEAVYHVALPAPTFSVHSETSWNDILVVRIDGAPGADILWSSDGVAWNQYGDSIVLGSSQHLWARCVKRGMEPGAVAHALYWIAASPPTFSVPSGASATDLMPVRLSTATPGASIQYSLDSGRSWKVYADSLLVGSSGNILARACKPGLANSPTSASFYDVAVAKPVLAVPSGTIKAGSVLVDASCATPGAAIQLSNDGSVWADYDGPFMATVSMHLMFRGLKQGMQNSSIAEVDYFVVP